MFVCCGCLTNGASERVKGGFVLLGLAGTSDWVLIGCFIVIVHFFS